VETSLIGYVLAVWPFFAVPETHLARNLTTACAFGMVPALVLTAFSTRRFGLPGACGGLGVAMATGVFLYLRMDQIMLGFTVRDLPRPDYPSTWAWIVPSAYVVATVAVGLLLLPRDTFSDEPPARSDR